VHFNTQSKLAQAEVLLPKGLGVEVKLLIRRDKVLGSNLKRIPSDKYWDSTAIRPRSRSYNSSSVMLQVWMLSASATSLYSAGTLLESLSGHRLFSLRFISVFLSPPRQMSEQYLKLRYHRFLPNNYRFIFMQ
jgi:hypothetical protein